MSFFTLKNLLDNDALSGLGGLAKEAAQEARDKAEKKMKESLVDQIGEGLRCVQSHVNGVKIAKKALEGRKKELKEVSRAVEYMSHTGNPLPFFRVTSNHFAAADFCCNVGVPVPDGNAPEWNIPDGWEPPADAE